MEEENTNYPIEFPTEPQSGAPVNLITFVALILAIISLSFGGFVFYKITVLEKGQKGLSEELKSTAELVATIENERQTEETQPMSNNTEIGSELQEQKPTIEENTVSSRDKTRKQDLKTIAAGLEKYKTANKSYPVSRGLEKLNNSESKTNKALIAGRHLASMPKDPLDSEGRFYGYKSTPDGEGYQLSASLEDKSDPEGKASGSLWLYVAQTNWSNLSNGTNKTNGSNGSNLTNLNNNATADEETNEDENGDEDEEDDSEEENFELE